MHQYPGYQQPKSAPTKNARNKRWMGERSRASALASIVKASRNGDHADSFDAQRSSFSSRQVG
jgi:hypothetical protein